MLSTDRNIPMRSLIIRPAKVWHRRFRKRIGGRAEVCQWGRWKGNENSRGKRSWKGAGIKEKISVSAEEKFNIMLWDSAINEYSINYKFI